MGNHSSIVKFAYIERLRRANLQRVRFWCAWFDFERAWRMSLGEYEFKAKFTPWRSLFRPQLAGLNSSLEGVVWPITCEAHEIHPQNEHSRRGAPCLKTLCMDWDG